MTFIGWSDYMFKLMDATGFMASGYFLVLIFILSFVVAQLFVAVVCSVYSLIQASHDDGKSVEGAADSNDEDEGKEVAVVVDASDPNFLAESGGEGKEEDARREGVDIEDIVVGEDPMVSPMSRESSENGTSWDNFRRKLKEIVEHPRFEHILWCVIILNVVCLAMEYDGMSEEWENALFIAEIVFITIFSLEIALKLIVYYPREYFSNGLNVIDFTVVFFSILALILFQNGVVSVFRVVRIARVFRVLDQYEGSKSLLACVLKSWKGILYLLVVIAFALFVMSVMGLQAFSGYYKWDGEDKPRPTFDTIGYAFLTMFQMLTIDDWPTVLMNGMRTPGSWFAPIFFVFFVVIGNYVIVNIFVAVILENFGLSEEEKTARQQEEYWKKFEAAKRHYRETLTLRGQDSRRKLRKKIRDDLFSMGLSETGERKGQKKNASEERFVEEKPSETSIKEEDGEIKSVASVEMENFPVDGEEESPTAAQPTEEGKEERVEGDDEHIRGNGNQFWRKLRFKTALLTSKHAKRQVQSLLDSTDENGNVLEVEELTVEEAERMEIEKFMSFPVLRKKSKMIIGRTLHMFSAESKVRKFCHALCTSKFWDAFVLLVVGFSVVMLVFESPEQSQSNEETERLFWIDVAFIVFFTFEAAITIIAFGLYQTPTAYFKDNWCRLDFFVLISMYLTLLFPGARSVRVLRVLRPLRVLARNEGMQVMVHALWNAIPRFFSVFLMSLLFVLIFAIIGLKLFSGLFYRCNDSSIGDKDSCVGVFDNENGFSVPRVWINLDYTFDHIGRSFLTLFEIGTLSNWHYVMYAAMDITRKDEQPKRNNSPWFSLYFIVFIVFGAFFLVNFFIGVIIQQINEERGVAFLTDKQVEWIDMRRKILLHKPKRLLVIQGSRFRERLHNFVSHKYFDIFIVVCVCLNVGLLATKHYGEPRDWSLVLLISDFVFVFLYVMEVVLKISAWGWSAYKSDNWNRFDFITTIGSLLSTVFELFIQNRFLGLLSLTKVFRLARVFRVVQYTTGIRFLWETLILSLPAVLNVGALLCIFIFMFAVLGVKLFGEVTFDNCINRQCNFRSVGRAFLLLLRLATGDNWNCLMYGVRKSGPECYNPGGNEDHCGDPIMAPIYFVSFYLFTAYILINLFVTIVLHHFSHVYNQVEVDGIHVEEIDVFGEEWQKFDPEAEAKIFIRKVFPLSLALAERDCEIGARVVSKRSNKRLMQILLREEKDYDKTEDDAGFHSVLLHMMELCLSSEYFPYPFSVRILGKRFLLQKCSIHAF
eukprot:TRINITY_DN1125_c0_g1_i15.p1 TRINITY_DN1125_c0_g1~~TRINITY_DN1125_c0_g1_i15.p1  ORF type:complete len:1490 (+),score=400.83 TRINITY_DN1125_c0_g1_i15:652-4470(+)